MPYLSLMNNNPLQPTSLAARHLNTSTTPHFPTASNSCHLNLFSRFRKHIYRITPCDILELTSPTLRNCVNTSTQSHRRHSGTHLNFFFEITFAITRARDNQQILLSHPHQHQNEYRTTYALVSLTPIAMDTASY